MARVSLLCVVLALALPSRALADVTVIYAPAAAPAPLVARPVGYEPGAGRARPEPTPRTPSTARTEPAQPRGARPGAARPEAARLDASPGDAARPDAPPSEPARIAAARPEPSSSAVVRPELSRGEPARAAARPEHSRSEAVRAAEPAPRPSSPAALPATSIAASSTPSPAPAPSRPPAARPTEPARCRAPVTLVRVADGGREQRSLVLLDCEGRPDAESLTALSVLARPPGTSAPSASALAAHAADPTWVAPSIRRLHPGLLERLRVIADAFPGHAIEIVSGVRLDARRGSRHQHGLALDLRVAGTSLDALHALASRFERTGVGLYPAANLVHIDVRPRATRWVDESRPGEPPSPRAAEAPARGRRISSAPPAASASATSTSAASASTAPAASASRSSAPAAPASAASTRAAPASPTARSGQAAPGDDTRALADEIAGEVTRALGRRWVPPPPPR